MTHGKRGICFISLNCYTRSGKRLKNWNPSSNPPTPLKKRPKRQQKSLSAYVSSASSIKLVLKLNETSQRSFVMHLLRTPSYPG